MFSTNSEMMKYLRALTEGNPLWVINTSNKKSDDGTYSKLSLSIRASGEYLSVVVPASSAPIDLTAVSDAGLVAIRTSMSFRDLLAKGYMVVISDEEAERLLGDPAIQKEVERVQNSQNSRGKVGAYNDSGVQAEILSTNTPVGSEPPAADPVSGRVASGRVSAATPNKAAAPAAQDEAVLAGADHDDVMLPFIVRFRKGSIDAAALQKALTSMAEHVTVADLTKSMGGLGDDAKEEMIRDIMLDLVLVKRAAARKTPAPAGFAAPKGLKLPGRK